MTIVDSSTAITNAINLVAEELGKPIVSRDLVLKFAAVPMNDLLKGLWGEWKQEWVDLYREKVAPIEHEQIRPFPEVPPTLVKLRQMGIFLAVASNRHDPKAAMNKSKMTQYFDAIVGPIDRLPHKPDPAMLNSLRGRFGVTKAETLYIGDSDIDIKTGLAADVRTIGVTTGYFTRGQLEDLGAWLVIDTMDELLPVVAAESDFGSDSKG